MEEFMNSFSNFFKFVFLCFSFSISAFATVEYIEPISSGYDCPQDLIVTTPSPDNSAISFLLNGTLLMEHQPGITERKTVNKRCVISIPLKASPKEQYVILTNDWRMYAGLPEKSNLSVTSRLWLSREITRPDNSKRYVVRYHRTKTQKLKGPYDSDFLFNHTSPEPKVTECGKAFKLTVELRLKLKNNNITDSALVDVDSYDLAQIVGPTIVKRDCE
jgi:hypothetical protein